MWPPVIAITQEFVRQRRDALGGVCVPFLNRSIELHVANDC